MTFIDYSHVQPMTQNDWMQFGLLIGIIIIIGTIALWAAVKNYNREKKNE